MFSGFESPWHLLLLALIALIVFGPKRLPELGRSLGSGIRGFKGALAGEDEGQRERLAGGENASAGAEAEDVSAGTGPGAP